MTLGIIAEDESDVHVIQEFTAKLLNRNDLGSKHFVGHGCGKLRRKCEAWSVALAQRGCTAIVVVHDLDNFDRKVLHAQLEHSISQCGAVLRIVLIPQRELEAWLLYDADALKAVFGVGKPPKLPGNPELEADPKRTLGSVVSKAFDKQYVSTIHNRHIAGHIDMAHLLRSASFKPYIPFAKSLDAKTPKRKHGILPRRRRKA